MSLNDNFNNWYDQVLKGAHAQAVKYLIQNGASPEEAERRADEHMWEMTLGPAMPISNDMANHN